MSSYGHIKLDHYYVPGFCAYGVMAACFTILAITLVNRREMGLLKRLRLSPLPTWMLMAAVFVNSMIIAAWAWCCSWSSGASATACTGPATGRPSS